MMRYPFVLLITTNALQHSPRRRRTVRRSHDEELSIDELERRERALSDDEGIWMDTFHTPDVHECARYRWTQDNNFVKVEVPLPRRPSETDVALVVGEASFDLSVVNADLVIRGQLSGEANPGRCGWDLFEEGDGLIVRVAKRAMGTGTRSSLMKSRRRRRPIRASVKLRAPLTNRPPPR